jgi:hypothetical protein
MPGNTPTGLVISAEQSVSAFTSAGLVPCHVGFKSFPETSVNDAVGGAS